MTNFSETYGSDHYIFHYHAHSTAHREIASIARTQEACFERITRQLGVSFPMKIEYYLCNSAQEVGMYDPEDPSPCNGFAQEPNKIYAVYSDQVQCIGPHEDAHLISYRINRPDSTFLREGLAMYFDREWWSIPNEQWGRYYLEQDRVPPLSDLLEDDCFFALGCAQTYPIAGSFVSWMLDACSKDAFLELYSAQADYTKILQATLQRPLPEIDQLFRGYLLKAELDEAARSRMSHLLRERR